MKWSFLVLLANTYYKSRWLGNRSKENLAIIDFEITTSSDVQYVFGHLDLMNTVARGLDEVNEVGELSDKFGEKTMARMTIVGTPTLINSTPDAKKFFRPQSRLLASYLPGFTHWVIFFDRYIQTLFMLSRAQLREVVEDGKTHEGTSHSVLLALVAPRLLEILYSP